MELKFSTHKAVFDPSTRHLRGDRICNGRGDARTHHPFVGDGGSLVVLREKMGVRQRFNSDGKERNVEKGYHPFHLQIEVNELL